jgi:hypothetical protein
MGSYRKVLLELALALETSSLAGWLHALLQSGECQYQERHRKQAEVGFLFTQEDPASAASRRAGNCPDRYETCWVIGKYWYVAGGCVGGSEVRDIVESFGDVLLGGLA